MNCSIKDCTKKAVTRTWCSKHYTKWQRHGDPSYTRPEFVPQKCIVESCERKQFANQMCATHNAKMKRTGTLEKINHGPEWAVRNGEARKTDLAKLDSTLDPNKRGYLAVNTISDIRYKAKCRGISWTLTQIEAYNLIISSCHYCGHTPGWPTSRVGIDRVDNTKGYSMDNCLSCCTQCNTAKGANSLEEFISWIKKINGRLSI